MSKQKLKLLILNCHHNESVEKESWLYLFQSSENFRRWNSKMENKMCYFPQDKNLSFFKHYSQVCTLYVIKLEKNQDLSVMLSS